MGKTEAAMTEHGNFGPMTDRELEILDRDLELQTGMMKDYRWIRVLRERLRNSEAAYSDALAKLGACQHELLAERHNRMVASSTSGEEPARWCRVCGTRA